MDEKIEYDFAEGSFLSRWPIWLRWLCFLPAALIVPLLITIVQNITTSWYLGIEGRSFWMELASDFILGGGFVAVGAMVAPKSQFLISIILLVILSIFGFFSFMLSFTSQT